MAPARRWLRPGESGRERMNEGLQRVAIYQTSGVFRQRFMRIYWHLFQTIWLNSLELWRFGHVFIEVRPCRTAVPHHRTALSEEFGVARRAHGT